MNCPREVAEVLLGILNEGILRIRMYGWANDSSRCAVEADHLHNLPMLLTRYSPELLWYYWNVERPSYLSHGEQNGHGEFQRLWERLGPLVPAERDAGRPRS